VNELFNDHILTVSALTSRLKEVLEGVFTKITLEGEVFNFRPASSGHWYFQLHDEEAAIQAVMFKSQSWRVPFLPKDGDRIIVEGDITIYAKRGNYQIVCQNMRKSGTGDLLALIEERKREFAALGYFDAQRKRPLPLYPKKIGVITSPTGAAVHDILQVLKRRNPTIDVVILPAAVQGALAADEIASQIRLANRLKIADLLIIGRGGGSIEDLLPFSERAVVEAIVESDIVTVSAVGHEIDWALSDYAADLRAPTPSAAGELVAPLLQDIIANYRGMVTTLAHLILKKVGIIKGKLALFTTDRMADYFKRKLQQAHLYCDDYRAIMERTVSERLKLAKAKAEALVGQLESLSPLAVLARGYSIVTHSSDGELINRASQLKIDEEVAIQFAKGEAVATVNKLFEEESE